MLNGLLLTGLVQLHMFFVCQECVREDVPVTALSVTEEGLPEVNGEPQDLSACLLYRTIHVCMYLFTVYPSLFLYRTYSNKTQAN